MSSPQAGHSRQRYQPMVIPLKDELRSAKIVGVGLQFEALGRRSMDAGNDIVFARIGLRLFLCRKSQLNLRLRIAAAGPPHQRIGTPRLGLLEFEQKHRHSGIAL